MYLLDDINLDHIYTSLGSKRAFIETHYETVSIPVANQSFIKTKSTGRGIFLFVGSREVVDKLLEESRSIVND